VGLRSPQPGRESVCEGQSECGRSLSGAASTRARWQWVAAWPERRGIGGDKGVWLGEEKGKVEGRPTSGAYLGWSPANRGGKRVLGGAAGV
jgi:hypothetical protein